MTATPPRLYQGRDWISERWTAAELCDSLDKIHDLCLYYTKEKAPALFQSDLSIIPVLMELMDTIHKNLLHLSCEIIPPAQMTPDFEDGWLCLEARRIVESLEDALTALAAGHESKTFQQLAGQAFALKTKICVIDQ